MKIKCLTTFLEGRDKFVAGDVRNVDDESGARFITNGWAVVEGETPVAVGDGESTLDIQNVIQTSEVKHG